MNVKSLLLAGVSASVVAGAAFAAPVAKEDMVLVVSVINTTNPYMISNIEGGKALSEELGIPLEIVNSNGSSQTEIAGIIDPCLGQDPDHVRQHRGLVRRADHR
jgi:ribose transport system substrate-binding protein